MVSPRMGRQLPAMTLPEYPSTPTRTGIIWSGVCNRLLDLLHLFQRQDVHHLVGIAPAAQQVSHDAHWPVDVAEELLVTCTQVV